MEQKFEIHAQRRTEFGTRATRRLRRAGQVPAIIYGTGKEPIPLILSHNELLKQLKDEGFYSRILTINIDNNQAEKAVLKSLQRHAHRPQIMHLDFQRISETEKLDKNVPLHFINEEACIGVKQGGGMISHHMTEVEILCLPKDLPEFIGVDLTNLQVNEILHLSDLVVPEGVELVALHGGPEHNLPVVSVHLPRGHAEDEGQEGAQESEG